MKIKTCLIGAICFGLNASAWAIGEVNHWSSGWGQGTTEYVVKGKGQSQLYIGCNPDNAMFVMFTDPTGQSVDNYDALTQTRTFSVSVDGGEPITFNDVVSRVGVDSMHVAWEKLRKGKAVTVTAAQLQPAHFTLNGAGKVLPAFGQSDCKIGAAIPDDEL
ncbi:hypothetical protein [Serratia liquefaciens]|uniref:hypothetical protein n=1 Tax=Serratia liquefaciens TaxID=614 RepID=UPI0021587B6C|nr:hypothetical protein [Serratia liquefaciens]